MARKFVPAAATLSLALSLSGQPSGGPAFLNPDLAPEKRAADDQLPKFDDYSMDGRTYRYFKGDPLYAFGYGLSYSTFQYSAPKGVTRRNRAGMSRCA
jgi:hypothetical protein